MTDSTEAASAKAHTARRIDGTTYSVREPESVTEAVVRAVSAEEDSHPTELEPLYSVIETNALNTLFAPRMSGKRRRANRTVAFRYSDCDIRVSENGEAIIKRRRTE